MDIGDIVSRVSRRVPIILAILLVVLAYWFFGSHGHFYFKSRSWDAPRIRPGDGSYASLAEGFLRGQLSMAHEPDERLKALPNPNDYEARQKEQIPYVWDASYFNGRYYLYFSPLPVLFFYIPFRLAYGAYPDDQLAGVIFAAWALIMAALFVERALGEKRRVPIAIWVLMLGLSGVVPFVLVFSRVYEVATLCGMAMTATWALSLLRYLESPRRSRLVWMSVWLGLAIASRPNLGVLLLVALIALPKPRLRPALIALIPLSVIGGSLLLYNYARFSNPLEFGLHYQLTYMPMANYEACACRSVPEAFRLVNNLWLYVFAPPYLGGSFPYVDLTGHRLDPAVSFSSVSEEVGGLAPMLPLAIFGSALALFAGVRRAPLEIGTRAASLIVAAGWVALVALSSCWYVTARYQVDFMLLIATGSVVLVDRMLQTSAHRGLAIAIACYSIILGGMLGFEGTHKWFAKQNPELVRSLTDLLE